VHLGYRSHTAQSKEIHPDHILTEGKKPSMADTEVGYALWGALQDGPKWFHREGKRYLVILAVEDEASYVQIYEPGPEQLCVAGNRLVMAQTLGVCRRRFAFPPSVDGLMTRLETELSKL
jgi:hypothetical protein